MKLRIIVRSFHFLPYRSLYKEILVERENSQPNEDNDEEQEANKENENAITLCFDCQRKSKINHTELYLSLLSAKLSSELTKNHLFQGIRASYNEKVCVNALFSKLSCIN